MNITGNHPPESIAISMASVGVGLWKRRNAKSNLYQLIVGRGGVNIFIKAAYYNFI
jgi:hypothetical protein